MRSILPVEHIPARQAEAPSVLAFNAPSNPSPALTAIWAERKGRVVEGQSRTVWSEACRYCALDFGTLPHGCVDTHH
jgi:hypothetical protein